MPPRKKTTRKKTTRKKITRKTKRLSYGQKFDRLNELGILPEQYSSKSKSALRHGEMPTVKEMNDGYRYFSKMYTKKGKLKKQYE